MTNQLQSTETQSGTISDFIQSRDSRLSNAEHEEAFCKEIEAMLVQLVMEEGSGFSDLAKLMMPKLDCLNVRKLNRWLEKLEFWYSHILDQQERGAVVNTVFIWS